MIAALLRALHVVTCLLVGASFAVIIDRALTRRLWR